MIGPESLGKGRFTFFGGVIGILGPPGFAIIGPESPGGKKIGGSSRGGMIIGDFVGNGLTGIGLTGSGLTGLSGGRMLVVGRVSTIIGGSTCLRAIS
jgi:hypothetical protein